MDGGTAVSIPSFKARNPSKIRGFAWISLDFSDFHCNPVIFDGFKASVPDGCRMGVGWMVIGLIRGFASQYSHTLDAQERSADFQWIDSMVAKLIGLIGRLVRELRSCWEVGRLGG